MPRVADTGSVVMSRVAMLCVADKDFGVVLSIADEDTAELIICGAVGFDAGQIGVLVPGQLPCHAFVPVHAHPHRFPCHVVCEGDDY